MTSISVITFEPAKYRNGEMVSGPSQSAETSKVGNVEEIQNKLDGLGVYTFSFLDDPKKVLAAARDEDVTVLLAVGKSRSKENFLIFVNGGSSGPNLDI